MAKGYNEIKEILEREYADYFEILDLDMQIRNLFFIPQEQWQEILLKNLKNHMECDKIISQTTGLSFHQFYKDQYEKKLKIYNKIMEGVK